MATENPSEKERDNLCRSTKRNKVSEEEIPTEEETSSSMETQKQDKHTPSYKDKVMGHDNKDSMDVDSSDNPIDEEDDGWEGLRRLHLEDRGDGAWSSSWLEDRSATIICPCVLKWSGK